MAIQEQNIVFLKSQVMDDVPEGGGAATGNLIADGVMNNVFEDISDLARAYGNFSLRKIFLAVRTLSTDLYGGAKTVVTQLPTDSALSYTLFTTNAPFDTRVDASDAVGAYLYKGPKWHGHLDGDYIAGMSAIRIIQRPDTALPPIGRTLCLVQNEGLVSEIEQYVRVSGVSYVATTYTDASGDFVRWIVTLTLTDVLRFAFKGHEAQRLDAAYNYSGKTRIRDSTIADATRYYGAQRLTLPVVTGALQVRAASLFTRLVPSAQTETPLVNRPLAGEVVPMVASAAAPVTYTAAGAAIAPSGRLVLRTGAMAGSIAVTVGAVTFNDDGAGNAIRNGATIGTVNYPTGEILFDATAPTASGSASITYLPGVAVAQQAHTRALPVTAENRRLNWIETLLPLPAPGVLEIAYMAQGNWYTLRDDGSGAITGSDTTFGAGTVSYVTGSAPVTLGALPDVGSQIMYTWASPVHYAVLVPEPVGTAEIVINSPRITDPITPGTLTLTWQVDGVTKTATDTGATGAVSGDATGTVLYATPEIRLSPTVMPDAGTSIAVTFTKAPRTTGATGTLSLDVGEALAPFSVEAAITLALPDGTVGGQWLHDDGQGNLKLNLYSATPQYVGGGPYYVGGTVVLGTVNYATGLISVNGSIAVSTQAWDYVTSTWQYSAAGNATVTDVGLVSFVKAADASPGGANVTVPIGETPDDMPLITISPAEPAALVPDSMSFVYGGKAYVDRAGTLYTDIDPATGSGIVAGTVNHATREARVTHYATGATGVPVLKSALGRYGDWSTVEASVRTPVAPLKPESVSLVATTADGEQITGVADADGVVTGTWMRGNMNYEFGTGAVEFGQMSGSPAVWTPRAVDPATIRYNAVGYTYLPLDASILGIDPVRLPPDGRVPIYRPGDLALVMHAAETAPVTIADGGTIACGRTRLAWVRVLDANGATVTSGYTVDRAAGTVTVPSVAGLAQPLKVRHTVADLRQITDAQISGLLTLARPLTHDYPADETIVASCLIHGDRRARVSAVWDQATWDGSWVDNLVGNAATPSLNTIAYPVTVTNEGAETERWLLRWTNATNVELIGERIGLVYSGPFNADIAPINPRTREPDGTGGVPYLTIPLAANGGGWSAGNVVRINTVGALADMWIARAIQQSDEPAGTGADGCELYALGNIDRP